MPKRGYSISRTTLIARTAANANAIRWSQLRVLLVAIAQPASVEQISAITNSNPKTRAGGCINPDMVRVVVMSNISFSAGTISLVASRLAVLELLAIRLAAQI